MNENTDSTNLDEPANQLGRPSTYSQDLADKICTKLARGISLRTVCREDWAPAMSTVFLWLRTHKAFSEQYVRAKEESSDAMAEDILDIADTGHNDLMLIKRGGEEVKVPDNEVLQRSKLRVDTRKWLMSKMKPKKYGEKLDMTSGGEKLPIPILNVLPNHSDKKDTGTV